MIERGISHRRAAWLMGMARSGLHYVSKRLTRDQALIEAIRTIAHAHPQWGYRLVWGRLRMDGWVVGRHRVHRLWRAQGLCLPARKRRRKVRTGQHLCPKALKPNDVWCWDFVHDACADGQTIRCLTVKDEASGYGLAIDVQRAFNAEDVIQSLTRLIRQYGRPRFIRSDNGPELIAKALCKAFEREGIKPCPITPGKPWQNGSSESYNGTYRRECLDAEIFLNPAEAQIISSQWRKMYNTQRPHSQQGYRPPAEVYLG